MLFLQALSQNIVSISTILWQIQLELSSLKINIEYEQHVYVL